MTVDEAKAAVDATASRVTALEAELLAAKRACIAAENDLRAAKVLADSLLPKARMVKVQTWTGKRFEEAMVIAKRTAKKIIARRPGCDQEVSFRSDASGVWNLSPRSISFVTLELDE